jgi:peptidoglycan/LPS O-acetylase OafA/YrhL
MKQYRRDIDGLRALAVISVVLYHAQVGWLGGGYVGVDVFFVISGYLITKYVDHRIRDGKFSIVAFYERRVRRIMPALFFLLIVASALAYFALLPNELYNFSKAELATTLFAPNIFFYREAGYFDAAAKLKPLLHMWSLGVEEQFYIFLPLTMIIASRGRRRGILTTLWAGFVGSLVLSIWQVKQQPSAAFYLVPSRGWELLLGSLIGVRAFPRIYNALLRNALSGVGVVLVLVSLFLYSPDTPFPGLAALLPCLGTGLAIYGNEAGPTVMGRLLSCRPMVGFGLISYSLYLWHWPLLVFGEQFFGRPLTKVETAMVVLLSVAAATASWKFVEQPFRTRTVGASRPALFSTMGAVALFVIFIAAVGIADRGLPQRVPPQALQYASGGTDRDSEISSCKTSLQRIQKGDLCRLGSSKSSRIDFVVWGDSHADAIAPAFRVLANEAGMAGWLATHPGCAPLLGIVRISSDASGCDQFNDVVMSLIEQYDVPTVFLVGRWEVNALGRTHWEISEGLGKVTLRDAYSKETSPAETRAVFERGLTRTLSRLSRGPRRVVLVMDVPNTAIDTPVFLAKSAMSGNIGPEVRIDILAHGGRVDSMDGLLTRLCQQWHVVTIDPKLSLCSGSQCLVAKSGRSLYRDDHHLSMFGALQLVDLIRPSFHFNVVGDAIRTRPSCRASCSFLASSQSSARVGSAASAD